MTIEETTRRLENISSHAVHTIEEESFIMSLDDGIAIKMAIKSLEAWELVKQEIDEATEIHSDGEFYIKNFDVKRIINKHLAEVRE